MEEWSELSCVMGNIFPHTISLDTLLKEGYTSYSVLITVELNLSGGVNLAANSGFHTSNLMDFFFDLQATRYEPIAGGYKLQTTCYKKYSIRETRYKLQSQHWLGIVKESKGPL
jgi:hypothetical protein